MYDGIHCPKRLQMASLLDTEFVIVRTKIVGRLLSLLMAVRPSVSSLVSSLLVHTELTD